MKLRHFITIMMIVLVLGGCAVPENIKDTGEKVSERTSSINELTEQLRNEGEIAPSDEKLSDVSLIQESLSDVTHLKVIEFRDYAPFYSISFQKIEGETGNVLLFEGSTDGENSQIISPNNIRVEPEEDIWELGYWFDGNTNLDDTVTLQFWNRGNADSLMIEIDELQYELKLSTPESKMITLNQVVEPLDITIQYVVKYSNALLFELEGKEIFNHLFLLTDANDSRKAPTRVAYNPDDEDKIQLLYVFETPIENDDWIMSIKNLSNQSKEQNKYVECNLIF